MPPSRLDFEDSLRRGRIPCVWNGRDFYRWTCVQLRQIIRLLDPYAVFGRGHRKINLCQQLTRIRPEQRLTPIERHAIEAIVSPGDPKEAYRRLHYPHLQSSRWSYRGSRYVREIYSHQLQRWTPERIEPQQQRHPIVQHRHLANLLRVGQCRECTACLQDYPANHFQTTETDAECHHFHESFCLECCGDYIEARSRDSPLDEMPCPAPECAAILSYQQVQQNARPETFRRYDEFCRRRLMEQHPEYYRCAHCDTHGGFVPDDHTQTFMICNDENCGGRTCIDCDSAWHLGITCAENLILLEEQRLEERAAEMAEEEGETENYMLREVKSCPAPHCGVRTVQDGGCDHMTSMAIKCTTKNASTIGPVSFEDPEFQAWARRSEDADLQRHQPHAAEAEDGLDLGPEPDFDNEDDEPMEIHQDDFYCRGTAAQLPALRYRVPEVVSIF